MNNDGKVFESCIRKFPQGLFIIKTFSKNGDAVNKWKQHGRQYCYILLTTGEICFEDKWKVLCKAKVL